MIFCVIALSLPGSIRFDKTHHVSTLAWLWPRLP